MDAAACLLLWPSRLCWPSPLFLTTKSEWCGWPHTKINMSLTVAPQPQIEGKGWTHIIIDVGFVDWFAEAEVWNCGALEAAVTDAFVPVGRPLVGLLGVVVTVFTLRMQTASFVPVLINSHFLLPELMTWDYNQSADWSTSLGVGGRGCSRHSSHASPIASVTNRDFSWVPHIPLTHSFTNATF